MTKIVSIALVLSIVLIGSMLATAFAAPPPVQRQMEIITATIDGGNPQYADPAAAYDTASGAILLNCYDTLIVYDGEHLDRYLGSLATEWTVVNNTAVFGAPIHDAATGLDFGFSYVFKIRQGVPYQDSSFGNVTPADVEFSIERTMVMDFVGGPQWMFFEPLLNGADHDTINNHIYDCETNTTDRNLVGLMIDHSVTSNSTHVTFNLAYPGAYAPFIQILTQTWGSVISKAWANSLGRPTMWPGNWPDHTSWFTYCNPDNPPLDDPTPVVMGSGPYQLAHLDQTLKYWDANRFTGYWRGWGNAVGNYGIGWPAFGGSKPAGYVNHFVETWAYDWNARSTKFLNGEVDFCAIPRQYMNQMLNQPDIRCTYPLPSMACDAMFYAYNIRPTSPFGPIFDYGVLGETGIPRDFFGNATYGKYMRQAFAQLIDFDKFLQIAYLGEALQPPTALIPSLPYYNGSVPKWSLNIAAATDLFKKWPGLWDTGFTMKILWNTGNIPRQTLCDMLANNTNALNPKFHVQSIGLDWATILAARNQKQLALFTMGWLADYPDPHNFAYPFYDTYGTFSSRQEYSSPTMDALINQGIATPDGPARGLIYGQIQQLAHDDCPSVALDFAVGRHFEQTWVCGWYYNPVYPDNYIANLWKWYYTPHAQQDTIPANSTGNALPYDVNYDGKTNMIDIGTTAASFGAIYGPPMGAKWVYRADFNNDRKIDMKDIGGVAKNFGKTSVAWTPTT